MCRPKHYGYTLVPQNLTLELTSNIATLHALTHATTSRGISMWTGSPLLHLASKKHSSSPTPTYTKTPLYPEHRSSNNSTKLQKTLRNPITKMCAQVKNSMELQKQLPGTCKVHLISPLPKTTLTYTNLHSSSSRKPNAPQTTPPPFTTNYNKFQSNNDVITLVRKDIKANMLQQPQQAFSCTILKVQGESTPIHVANIYARDNQLNLVDLQYLFDTYNNLILAGDLNAKDHLIFPHTQKTKYNSNGKQLHIFLEGLDGPFSIPAEVTVHNDKSPDSWTHIKKCGTMSKLTTSSPTPTYPTLTLDDVYQPSGFGVATIGYLLFQGSHI